MSFDFVPQITSFKASEFIETTFEAVFDSEYIYNLSDGRLRINPAIISESVGQLLSLLVMKSSDFKYQAVFFGVDTVSYPDVASPGENVSIRVEITDWQDMLVVSRSVVYCGGKEILRTETGKSVLLPLDDFRCANKARLSFQEKTSENRSFPEKSIVVKETPYFIHERKTEGLNHSFKVRFDPKHPMFLDHFPRRPIIPGVSLLTVIGEQLQAFDQRKKTKNVSSTISYLPIRVQNLRFKRELLPGEDLSFQIELESSLEDILEFRFLIYCGSKKAVFGNVFCRILEIVDAPTPSIDPNFQLNRQLL